LCTGTDDAAAADVALLHQLLNSDPPQLNLLYRRFVHNGKTIIQDGNMFFVDKS
jgi:hypothetical protein